MDILDLFELLFGSIGIILGLFFSIFFVLSHKSQPRANIFLAIYLTAYSIRIGKSLFHNYYEIDPTIRNLCLSALACVGPSLWLYSNQLIKRTIRRWQYFHYLPFVVLLCSSPFISSDGTSMFIFFYNFLIFHMFVYVSFTIYWLVKTPRVHHLENGSKIRNWLLGFLSINLFIICVYFLISEGIIPFYLGLSFLFSLMIVVFSFWSLKSPFLFKIPVKKYEKSNVSIDDSKDILRKLDEVIENEKPFLNSELTLSILSESINVTSKNLSQVINQEKGLNYSQFISQCRVQEAKRLLRSTTHEHYTIAAIAYDSGFNSISSFNAAFKKLEGQTAASFRKSQK